LPNALQDSAIKKGVVVNNVSDYRMLWSATE
jgi:hypothetical protein